MVLGVCRRILHNEHDVEDAFQATFLVLVRKAGSVQPRDLVGHWLYGVAYRTALRAQAQNAKPRDKEKAVPRPAEPTDERWQEVWPLLDQELNGLPQKYRIPVVLCDLEGKSRKEVAGVLGWSEGTLSSCLARARALLARRWSRRGVTCSGGAWAALVAANGISACVPAPLVSSTLKAAMLVAAGKAVAAACTSLNVATLAKGAGNTMFFAKLKLTPLWCGAAALGIGIGGVIYQTRAELPDHPNQPALAQGQGKPQAGNAKDSSEEEQQQAPATTVQPGEPEPKGASEAEKPGQEPPRILARRLQAFEAAAEAIQSKADADIQVLRDKLIEELQALHDTSTKAGKLDEAMAIRDRIKSLKITREAVQNLLLAAQKRPGNLRVNSSFEEGPDTPNDGIHNLDTEKGSTVIRGWVVTEICASPVDSAYWRPVHGKRSVALSWRPGAATGGSIRQHFQTKKGQKYRVSY
jgi:RNA polymerase sigma factor (sigma-70 family)